MRFTSRTIVALCLASALVLVAPVGVMLGAIVLVLAAATVDALAVRSTPEVRRTVGAFARGQRTAIRVDVNAGRAGRAQIRQPLPPDMDWASPVREQASLVLGIDRPEDTDTVIEEALVPRRRGTYTLAPVAVRLDGPLRLGRWFHELGEPAEVHVYPDLPTAHRLVQAVRQRSIRSIGSRRHGPLGLGTDFESVRDYHPDDDVRQINWRATARMRKPMSNNLRVEQDTDVWVLVDSGRLSAASMRVNGVLASRLDLFLDAAAAVGLVADSLSDRFGFVTFAERVDVHLEARRRGGAQGIEAAFRVQPSLRESDYASAFARVSSMRRSTVMVFTDLIDDAAATGLAAALPLLTRKHDVAVVGVTDPEMVRARTIGTPGEQLAMVDVDDALQEARARVTATGAHVVFGPADSFAEVGVRLYLSARAGRTAVFTASMAGPARPPWSTSSASEALIDARPLQATSPQ